MSIRWIHVIVCFIMVIPGQQLAMGEQRRCRCLADNPLCWPNASAWQIFNTSIGGRLLVPKPSAAVCNGKTYDAQACTLAKAQWSNSTWRGDQLGAMQNHNWENSSCSILTNSTACNQGSVPVYAVSAISPEHVQETVRFATANNLRLVIKSTGHDYLGRSTAAGSLLLWLHQMKTMTLIERYSSCSGETISNAARIGAGVQWGEVYRWLNAYNLTAIGGASATVSVAGGYLQGGGHSPLSRWKGLAADQVLEYDVVTADGQRQTVNACQNGDLFWALNGGGGGTYAIVLSVALKTFPTPSIAAATYEITTPNLDRYRKLVEDCIRFISTVINAGWSGYFSLADMVFRGVFHVPNGNLTAVIDALSAFAARNPDLDFGKTAFFNFSSFYDYFVSLLEPSNPTGFNVLLSSRLIPETTVLNLPEKVADAFSKARGQSGNGSVLLGHIVAGGQVSDISSTNNSVNPGWRTALLHMVYSQAWLDTTPEYIQNFLATEVTRRATILDELSTGSQLSCYTNEADPNEVNWQTNFFGSQAIYNQLKAIKNRYDPLGLFVCKNCVGSDDWTSDLNCPITSDSSTTPQRLLDKALNLIKQLPETVTDLVDELVSMCGIKCFLCLTDVQHIIDNGLTLELPSALSECGDPNETIHVKS
ncbi:unnamed protein product [Rotaria sp. Silwood2]|nr:unnamed protein product [Rotaria sp. Silwood2]